MATANGFVDRTAELDFILTKMDGRQRCDMLGIEERHYMDPQLARQWHDQLATEGVGMSEQAKTRLRDLYMVMIGD